MLKRIATVLAATLCVSAPAVATPSYLNTQHARLWDTLENAGVGVYLNPKQVCERENAPMGMYVYSSRANQPLMAICQDNRTESGDEVAWTDNDLDTLRHEAMHFIQDCVDGRLNGSLDPYFDGEGPSPATLTYRDVIVRLGYYRANNIARAYKNRGADLATIRLEHEAFAVATYAQADQITDKINQICHRR